MRLREGQPDLFCILTQLHGKRITFLVRQIEYVITRVDPVESVIDAVKPGLMDQTQRFQISILVTNRAIIRGNQHTVFLLR